MSNATQPPRDYIVLSLLSLIYCNVCFGLPAFIFSVKSRDFKHNGKNVEAERTGLLAKRFSIAAIACGAVLILIIFILQVISVSSKK